MTLLASLRDRGLIDPPTWLPDATSYLVVTGSTSYGVSNDTSDMDVVGFSIPKEEEVFPHLDGYIFGFGEAPNPFNVWTKHHIDAGDTEYDFTIYSIVKFFNLCMQNNPNMVDVLFVPDRCILFADEIGKHVRANRHQFLHKGSYHKFRGYSFQQMNRLRKGDTPKNEKRAALVQEFGYDTKFAYHVVRLALEAEQILGEGDLDLERNADFLKSIRAGAMTFPELEKWVADKETLLEQLYESSTLRYEPDQKIIKGLMIDCLEMKYGKTMPRVGCV